MFTALRKLIEKLAKENEKEFQGQAPDCCTINRPESQPRRHEKEE